MTNVHHSNNDVADLVSEYRSGDVGRRAFLRRIVTLGVSSATAYALLNSAQQASAQNFTTQAVGEEGSQPTPSPTTFAVGEEGHTSPSPNPPTATTQAFGEESGPPASTRALGEEGQPAKATTWNQGEESTTQPIYTSHAIGEESNPRPNITTYAVGEETSNPPITTHALGEESTKPPTTLAVGEEGQPKWVTPPPTTSAQGEETTYTTHAVGEEGSPSPQPSPQPSPPATTFAVGEEGSTPSRQQNRPSIIPQLPNVWRNWRRW